MTTEKHVEHEALEDRLREKDSLIEHLVKLNAKLIEERDLYYQRRLDASETAEMWREKCHKLDANCTIDKDVED